MTQKLWTIRPCKCSYSILLGRNDYNSHMWLVNKRGSDISCPFQQNAIYYSLENFEEIGIHFPCGNSFPLCWYPCLAVTYYSVFQGLMNLDSLNTLYEQNKTDSPGQFSSLLTFFGNPVLSKEHGGWYLLLEGVPVTLVSDLAIGVAFITNTDAQEVILYVRLH